MAKKPFKLDRTRFILTLMALPFVIYGYIDNVMWHNKYEK